MDGCKFVQIISFRNCVLLNLFWANDNIKAWSCNGMAVTLITKCWAWSLPRDIMFFFAYLCRCYQLYGGNTAWVAAARIGLSILQVLVTFCQLLVLLHIHYPTRIFFLQTAVIILWFVSCLLICEWYWTLVFPVILIYCSSHHWKNFLDL